MSGVIFLAENIRFAIKGMHNRIRQHRERESAALRLTRSRPNIIANKLISTGIRSRHPGCPSALVHCTASHIKSAR